MKKFTLIFLLAFMVVSSMAQTIKNPKDFFGFMPGDDQKLFDYKTLISYFQHLDAQSDKLKLIEIGESPMGRKMYVAMISSAENIAQLDALKNINKELALNSKLTDSERNTMIDKGKVFCLATLSMHSTEVAPAQASPLYCYSLLTDTDERTKFILNNVVFMVVPNHNPDGMDMIVEHYNKYKGTLYEGSSMPGVYHKYVGHDNNRDFVTLTQTDSKAIARLYNTEWFPQVFVEKHQMGATGPRYYVPPSHDPIAEVVPEEIWTWIGTFGSTILKDMTLDGHSGVSTHYLFDEYWPGATGTCMWKNVIAFLTEAASVRVATPIYIEPSELRVGGKGLSEYKKSVNMPMPWDGGWWRLSDLVNYEISSINSMLHTAALFRKDILKVRNDLCKKMIEQGKTEAPYYYIMPRNQHDLSELSGIVNLMLEHGVEVYELNKNTTNEGITYQQGDIVIPLSQPYRPFIKEVMEKQQYPERHYTPNGELIKPYDIASWSLPLHRAVSCTIIENRNTDIENNLKRLESKLVLRNKTPENYKYVVFSANNNESYKAVFAASSKKVTVYRTKAAFTNGSTPIPAGSFLIEKNNSLAEIIENLSVSPEFVLEEINVEKTKITFPRIALVETYFHDMDAGWTRFVFDSYQIPFTVLRPSDLEKTDWAKNFDVVVFPDKDKNVLMEGKTKSSTGYFPSAYPPEFAKGMGKNGFKKLMNFVQNGGIVLSWGASTALFEGTITLDGETETAPKEEFALPFRNEAENIQKNGLYIQGSLVNMKFVQNQTLTYGMPAETGVFYRGEQVFVTSIPTLDMDRRIIGLFPDKDILLSGFAEKEQEIANKAGMIWLKKGKGQLVLYAFCPQFRASTQGTFKLLFNGLLLEK